MFFYTTKDPKNLVTKKNHFNVFAAMQEVLYKKIYVLDSAYSRYIIEDKSKFIVLTSKDGEGHVIDIWRQFETKDYRNM